MASLVVAIWLRASILCPNELITVRIQTLVYCIIHVSLVESGSFLRLCYSSHTQHLLFLCFSHIPHINTFSALSAVYYDYDGL